MVSKSYHCFMIGDGKPCELADTIQPYFFMYPSSYQCFACHSVRKTLTFHYPAIEDSMRKLKIDASMKVNSINVVCYSFKLFGNEMPHFLASLIFFF